MPTSNGSDLIVRCPFCLNRAGSADISGHLYISTVDEVCHCFRCDYKAGWYQLISDVTGVSYGDARRELAESSMTPLYLLVRRAKGQAGDDLLEMPSNFILLADALQQGVLLKRKAEVAGSYVKGRLRSLIIGWEIYLGKWGIWRSSDWKHSVVMPVERGWWQERIIHQGKGPKYLSAPAPKEDRLYNWQALGNDKVYVAEGIFSAVALGQSAVALCGKEATPEQIERLGRSKTGTYVVCLDAGTNRESLALAKQLYSYGKKVIVRWYLLGDPADMGVYSEEEFSWKSNVTMALR